MWCYVLSRREILGNDATLHQHLAHSGIVVDMLLRDFAIDFL